METLSILNVYRMHFEIRSSRLKYNLEGGGGGGGNAYIAVVHEILCSFPRSCQSVIFKRCYYNGIRVGAVSIGLGCRRLDTLAN